MLEPVDSERLVNIDGSWRNSWVSLESGIDLVSELRVGREGNMSKTIGEWREEYKQDY